MKEAQELYTDHHKNRNKEKHMQKKQKQNQIK